MPMSRGKHKNTIPVVESGMVIWQLPLADRVSGLKGFAGIWCSTYAWSRKCNDFLQYDYRIIGSDITVVVHIRSPFLILGGIHKPCYNTQCQDGVVRADLAIPVDIALVEERFYFLNDLYSANEVFLTGTITEVLPVVMIDGNPIGDGKAGPISKQLFGALHERIRNLWSSPKELIE